jgi:hypothetical protein
MLNDSRDAGARRSSWRFSLRELLLVMLAAAAFIGWGTLLYRTARLRPTPFFTNSESLRQDLVVIYQELGEPTLTGAWPTMMHSEGTAAVQRTMIFRVPLSPKKKSQLLQALVAKVRERFKKEGCRNTGQSGGSSSNVAVSVLGYEHERNSGTVQICVLDAGDEHVAVIVTMQETSTSGRRSFGLQTGG